MLRQVFSQFGELVHVKIPVGKRCGFVQFVNRANAEQAISMLNGSQLGGQSIRLSWGRSPTSKQQDQTQWKRILRISTGYDDIHMPLLPRTLACTMGLCCCWIWKLSATWCLPTATAVIYAILETGG
uniref:RRM domain-containing protein n=1 Tax=Cannabis sativa TaxID=3483 RepID=A0A803R9S1_CANSA